MKFKTLGEGFVSQRQPGSSTSTAGVARCVVTRKGGLVCTFVVQSAKGINGHQPMLARSSDGGATWTEACPIWPELRERYSIYGSVSAGPSGDLLYFGSRTPIGSPGESMWSEETQGLRQNELFWTHSTDDGATWDRFTMIPLPIPGSAEAPGAMCATRKGDLVFCYSPYPTFDPKVRVQRNQVVSLTSRDGGRSWSHTAMLSFPHHDSGGAEAWVVELSDGRLLGTSWHTRPKLDPPNAYAISSDTGATWSRTLSTGTFGQTTSLAPFPDGRVLFAYNQRKFGDIGIWLALVRPTEADFGIEINQCVWSAEIASKKPGATDHEAWTGFAFGSPKATLLPDGSILVTLWSLQPSGYGIRYVKLALT